MHRKKGTIGDQMLFTVIFLLFSLSILIAATVWGNMNQPLSDALAQANGGTIASGSALAISQTSTTLLMFDQLFIFMVIGSFIAMLISSFWLNTHPVFFIITFIGFVFSFVIYAIMGNIYAAFEQSPGIQPYAADYPLMEQFWMNIPIISLLFSALLIIILYSKYRGGRNAYSA